MNKKKKTYSKDDKDSVTPELSLNNEPKIEVYSVSHHSINTDVVCSQSLSDDEFNKNVELERLSWVNYLKF